MADDQKNAHSIERKTKEKKFQQAQIIVNRKNPGNSIFTSRNKGRKVLHIGVKH